MIFYETAQEACQRVVQEFRESGTAIKQLWSIPCFCTYNVPRVSNHGTLHDYTKDNLSSQTRTHHHLGLSSEHPEYTKNMQIELEQAVSLINQRIYKINENTKMHTPKIDAVHIYIWLLTMHQFRCAQCPLPASTRRGGGVDMTTEGRHDVVLTSRWRRCCIVYPLAPKWLHGGWLYISHTILARKIPRIKFL